MKRILFVVPDRKMGGVSILLDDLLNYLPMNKYKIDLLILNNDGDRIAGYVNKQVNIIYGNTFFKAIDTPISYFKHHFDLRLLFSKLRLMFLLKTGLIKKKLVKERKKILSENYDVEVAFKDGFCAIFTAVSKTPKKIHWIHSSYGANDPTRRYRKTFQKNIYDKFDKIIAVSKKTAFGFNKHYGMQSKTIVVKNLIDDRKVKLKGKKAEKLSDKKFNFISVGRLVSQKGYDRLLKVIARLKNENLFNDSFLTIVGDGPLKDHLDELKKSLNLDCVKFAGKQANPYKFVAGADMYISAARFEPFGLVMVESLILHVPVLAVETEATSVIIKNNVNGLIVDNSEEGLYLGLKKILCQKHCLEELKQQALHYDYAPVNNEVIKTIMKIFDEEGLYEQS